MKPITADKVAPFAIIAICLVAGMLLVMAMGAILRLPPVRKDPSLQDFIKVCEQTGGAPRVIVGTTRDGIEMQCFYPSDDNLTFGETRDKGSA